MPGRYAGGAPGYVGGGVIVDSGAYPSGVTTAGYSTPAYTPGVIQSSYTMPAYSSGYNYPSNYSGGYYGPGYYDSTNVYVGGRRGGVFVGTSGYYGDPWAAYGGAYGSYDGGGAYYGPGWTGGTRFGGRWR
jgi:hypothetical protein